MPGILWLASYPKSGNTWMRAFIANLIDGGTEPLTPDAINQYCPGAANAEWFRPLTDKPVEELTLEEVAALREPAQKRAVSLNPNVIPMKTHNYLGDDFGHPMISMDVTGGAIYIVRDPRDVALSAGDHFGLPLDETIKTMNMPDTRSIPRESGDTGKQELISEVQSSWSVHVASWTQRVHPRLIVVRYEDLLSDTVAQLTGIAMKVGITRDQDRIRRAIEFSSFKRLQKLEEEHGFLERSEFSTRFFRSGKSGGWQDQLTTGQVEQIEHDHAEQMKRFGYL